MYLNYPETWFSSLCQNPHACFGLFSICVSDFCLPVGALLQFFLNPFVPVPADTDLGRCLATDGLYLYTSNSSGRGLSKIGSGLHGTLR